MDFFSVSLLRAFLMSAGDNVQKYHQIISKLLFI